MIIFNRGYLFLFVVFFITLSGCVDKKSSVYNPEEVGIIMETTPGVIVASRQIVIAGLKKDTQYWGGYRCYTCWCYNIWPYWRR